MDLNSTDQNIYQAPISYSIQEQYVGVYEMEISQETIQIKVDLEGNDLFVSFEGIEGPRKEKLTFVGKAEESFGYAESYKFESTPDHTVTFLTMNYNCSGANHLLILTLPEKQLIAKKI